LTKNQFIYTKACKLKMQDINQRVAKRNHLTIIANHETKSNNSYRQQPQVRLQFCVKEIFTM